jgi:hypothetical protein
MPKYGAMAQISRPFQIALGAVALLGLVWVIALHRPGSSSSSSSTPAEPAVPTPASTKAGATTQSSGATAGKSSAAGTYHGSAPGVAGLTGAIAKAHGAVAASQQNAKQLEQKSAQASSSTATAVASTPSSASSPRTSTHSAAPTKTSAPSHSSTHSSSSKTSASKAPSLARQHLVEDELAQGRIVALLFWSPKGADDSVDRNALEQLAKHDHGLAVHVANASEVASFGTITRGIQIFGTPTLLIVGPHGKTHTLTGLQDEYAIQQTVSEARHPHA